MGRIWMAAGALAGAGAVGMAAAAAHALATRLDAKAMAAMQSAIQLQGWHALALVLTGLWLMRAPPLAHTLGNLAGAGFLPRHAAVLRRGLCQPSGRGCISDRRRRSAA